MAFVLIKKKKEFPDLDLEKVEYIVDEKEDVFTVPHKQFGIVVGKILSPPVNTHRYVNKIYPAIQELYKKLKGDAKIATIEEPIQLDAKRYFVIIREYGTSLKKFLEK